MKIYTSYFGNIKALRQAGIIPVCIALWPPRWFNGPCLRNVAPSYSILKQTRSDEEYTRRYNSEILTPLNVAETIELIKERWGEQPIALCCYEKPDEFCHRQLLAEALRKQGIEVTEFSKPQAPPQPSLFD